MRKRTVVCLIWWWLTSSPATGWGQSVPDLAGTVHILPQVDAQKLPDYQNASVASGLIGFDQDGSTLTVQQDIAEGESTAKAVIDWPSFNIGEKAAVHFNQQGYADWAILNRIHDGSPSQILGQLSADGHIYLINRNGILFGENSKINVHSLTASTLNLANEDFQDEIYDFHYEDYLNPGGVDPGSDVQIGIVNRGQIIAGEYSGKIFLFGQQVTNEGVVSAPTGQIALAAGSEISIRQPEIGDVDRIALGAYIDVKNNPGTVENSADGALLSDLGMVGMYGKNVIQNGVVRATTSPEKTSRIELSATDLVSLGADSWTATPISVSAEEFVGDKEAAQIVIRGITTGDTGSDTTATVKRVEQAGVIDAPSGKVTIQADERVYLESGSKIDVSGLWVDRAASDDVIESYLNSIQLRDDFGQKDGILKGQRVVYLAGLGSAIGDLSDATDSQSLTAAEQNVTGGTIDIQVGVNDPTAETCDIIIRDGAELDFSGGGYLYAGGARETTRLLAGNKIYSISDAPEWITYDKILGNETVVHRRFGVVDEYAGLYYGGAVPLLDYGSKYIQGADAGTLSLTAPRIVLDGTLNGSALSGPYQVFLDEEDVPDGVTGVLKPKSGTLTLGAEPPANNSSEEKDAVLEQATIVADTKGLSDFTAADELSPEQANVFSAAKLNESGLGQVNIYANTELTLTADASVELAAGGEFTASARRIIQEGNIIVPSGSVSLTLVDNVTSVAKLSGSGNNDRYVDLVGRYYLGEDGVIDVSGDSIDSLLAVIRYSLDTELRSGGSVKIIDQSTEINDLILKNGSRIDVSGSDAGSLTLRADNLVLDGELNGRALRGKTGGTLNLHAANVEIIADALETLTDFGADDTLPDDRQGLSLAADTLADTGFTNLSIQSINDLRVTGGVVLQPSRVRLQLDETFWDYDALNGEVGLAADGQPLPEDIGATSIRLASGAIFSNLVPTMEPNTAARTIIEAGAELTTAPTGSIVVAGPEVQIDGRLQASAGTIQAEASVGDLNLGMEAKLLATGWNQPAALSASSNYTPLDGGTVELVANAGDLTLAEGSLIDVSAAPLTQVKVTDAFNRTKSVTTAGDPGQVTLDVYGEADLSGDIAGHATRPSGQGGSLELAYSNPNSSVELSGDTLTLIHDGGFDAVTLRSWGGFTLADNINVSFGRSLTLDAPQFLASGDVAAQFTAPWLRLINTAVPAGTLNEGSGQLTLSGEWIDVVGEVRLDGFTEVFIDARRDLRVSDYDYSISNVTSYSDWAGGLRVPGNLTLRGSRIFPQVPEDFVELFVANLAADLSPAFVADFTFAAGGKITTLPGELTLTDAPASAGGSLTLEAGGGIEHQGTLLAPLGTLTLTATGTGDGGLVVLADGSILSVTGSASSQYGIVEDEVWYTVTKTDRDDREKEELAGAPKKTIEINGEKIRMNDGSSIDVSGGGRVFGYQFEPGIDGSENPLSGCLVIVADPDLVLPGRAIYLQGVDGLDDGVYSILPEEYAFRDDALVLIDLNRTYVSGPTQLTEEGFPIVGGYETVQGTDISSPILSSYAMRKASDVLKEGKFVTIDSTAGDGGDISMQAATTVVNGTLRAAALEGFDGGRVAMSGENVFIVSADDELPDDQENKLIVNGEAISGKGFAEIELGDSSITKTVTMEEESRLQAEKVTLAGSEKILLKSGSRIDAVSDDGEGEAVLVSPAGEVEIAEGAVVHAGDGLTLETSRLSLYGNFEIENSSLTLKGDRIVFLTDNLIPADDLGIFITQDFWLQFADFENIQLASSSDILFQGEFNLSVADTLSFDTTRIAGENGSVTLSAELIYLTNTTGTWSDDLSTDHSGTFTLSSATDIVLGSGEVLIDGFSGISLNAGSDLFLKGVGGLTTASDLTINAARVKVSGYRDADDVYQAADYFIDVGTSKLEIADLGVTSDEAGDTGEVENADEVDEVENGGGRLSIAAGNFILSGVVDNTAGTAVFDVAENINVNDGGQVLARGTVSLSGGTVAMTSKTGTIELAEGSLIDVSAGTQGDAGTIRLSGTTGGVVVNGELRGFVAEGGRGGSFDLDTASVSDLSTLNAKLTDGGFDERIAVRARTGDLVLDNTLKAHEVYLAADTGQLTLTGKIDTSDATEGGDIELHAGRDLLLVAGSSIDASGTDQGGSVLLNSSDGLLLQEAGATIDVAGTQGGTVHLRADRETATSGLKMDLQGEIAGASKVVVEAVQNYTTTGSTLDLSTYLDDATKYVANETALLKQFSLNADQLHLRAGIEVESAGDLTIAATDLAGARFNEEAGMLTVRSAGNLTVTGKLTDAPTEVGSLSSSSAKDSWGLTLVAGADGTAADPTSTQPGQGDLTVNAGAQVYSETGSVTLAAGNDMNIGKTTTGYMVNSSIPLTVGSYAGDLTLKAGGNLTLAGGVVQTAVGDIEVQTGGDLNLAYSGLYMGTIRTLGEAQGAVTEYWNYADGGDIHLSIDGSVNGYLNSNAWDGAYGSRNPKKWGALYNQRATIGGQTLYVTTQGLVTLGGGDLTADVGGDYYAQTGTFGSGDLKVSAGGELAGRFLNRSGKAELQALGNIGSENGSDAAVFEIGDTDLQVTSLGDLHVAAVVDPLLTRAAYNQNTSTWNTAYTTETKASLTSVGGDVVLAGDSPYYKEGATYAARERILPATMEIRAGRDIRLLNTFAMLPAAAGNLVLDAGRDIDGKYIDSSSLTQIAKIIMNDSDPNELYGEGGAVPSDLFALDPDVRSSLLHKGDEVPIVISAGRNIENIGLRLAKMAQITAEGDIRFIRYLGQNNDESDVSLIRAGENLIIESSLDDQGDFGIEHGGPGTLLVQAGNRIDLGSSSGIMTYGSEKNAALGTKGSDLIVISGYAQNLSVEQLAEFFSALKKYGENYSDALAAGDTALAQSIIEEARETLIRPALGEAPTAEERSEGKGDIDMVESLIRTSGGVDNIYIIAGGDANIGRTALSSDDEKSSDTGIATTAGGGISIFVVGDLNVNESRVMTFGGGDILAWSDEGDINAGRGSRTAISRPPVKVVNISDDPDNPDYVARFSPPAVGSGIRALTYDPDGVSGEEKAPDIGDIYLIAPSGIIDAGEAGIAGGRVILGATEVLNALNISFSFGSVGVPSASDSAAGIGALAGVSNLTEATSLMDNVSGFGPREELNPTQVVDSFIEKWIDVEVVGFDI